MSIATKINCLSRFQTDISCVDIPPSLNNPFEVAIPEIAYLAARELQQKLGANLHQWKHNFGVGQTVGQGKMFGVLVVRDGQGNLGYLSAFSAAVQDRPHHPEFVPALVNENTEDNFLGKGLTRLTQMCQVINNETDCQRLVVLKEERRKHSFNLQQKIFSHTHFKNQLGHERSVSQIFEEWNELKPAAGSGECAAPKLLQYAFILELQPVAIAEFWWGKPSKSKEHLHYYPSCRDKCHPLLSYMLNATEVSLALPCDKPKAMVDLV